MAPRVNLIDGSQAPLLAAPYYEGGDPGPIVAALAHVPELLDVTMPFLGGAFGPSALAPRIKEIVILRTSARLDCSYCIGAHSVVALDSGLVRAEVLELRGRGGPNACFDNPQERALIDWVDAVAGGAGPVPGGIGSALRAHFDEAEVVELTLLASATIMLNRFCTALALPPSAKTLYRLAKEDLL